MDSVNWKERLSTLLSRYKYVCIVVLAGLVLMSIPSREADETTAQPETVSQIPQDMSAQLEQILSVIDGVGKVRVLLTEAEGERTQYVYDEDRDQSGESSSLRRDTVIISDSERADRGLVEQVNPPIYLGAIIVCEGGDNPSVQLNVINAVSNATGLSTDRITVLKMK